MDAISVAIIVIVLSLGPILFYLFKSDFELRQQKGYSQLASSSINNTKKANNSKQQNGKSSVHQASKVTNANNNTKQVPLEIVQISAQNSVKQTLGKTNGINHPTNKVNAKQQQQQQQSSAKNNNKGRDNNNIDTTTRVADLSSLGLEPSLDELDSSVLLNVFNHQKQLINNNNNNNVKSSSGKNRSVNSIQPQQVESKGRSARKRQHSSSDYSSNASSNNYSSEQLFTLIAASTLSKDEVELAVETLLNKLESGESDWKQPKSDPLQRLKNQLRDSESALLTEIQNHEQTRARLSELRLSQLSNEKLVKDELVKVRKDFGTVNLALEQARCELSKQQLAHKQLKEDTSQVITKLEQEKAQLQSVLANTNAKETELRNELEDKLGQLKRYELSNKAQGEISQELEAKLHKVEMQLDQVRASKSHDDYEACAKIAELDADRMSLDKALKDQVGRMKEVNETNNLLENSMKELQLINNRQEDMLKRLRDERHVNEASMKRTLCEMEQELKELQSKLSANSASQDERLRNKVNQVERELNSAGQREQKLMSEMRELREGLSVLLPGMKSSDLHIKGDDWVHQYLSAVKQLAKTVDELRETNTKMISSNNNIESPSKKSVDKSTLTIHTNGGKTSRVGSPTSNGRSSRAGSHHDRDDEKKIMETKLLELNDYVAKLEEEVQKLEEEKRGNQSQGDQSQSYQQQIKELTLQRNKLEAQIKFGLDSLKVEQKRVQSLEEELSKCSAKAPQLVQ